MCKLTRDNTTVLSIELENSRAFRTQYRITNYYVTKHRFEIFENQPAY